MNIKRQIQKNIEQNLFKGKIIIIYGARQVGKTTLVKEIQKKYFAKANYFNCDEIDIRDALTDKTSTEIKAFLGHKKLIILDEAQRVKNIGLTLKLIIDNFPDLQIIATGSSSFDLSNKIVEPLTGRKIEYYLYPFSLGELRSIYSAIETDRLLETRMIFGMYPEIAQNQDNIAQNLKSVARSYAYKDVLQYQNIKNPEILEKLLQAIALQIGNEVSYNELSNIIGIDKNTVSNYISILEKSFIIFRLNPFSRNLRNELKKLRKIYFYDNGIRNALINNLNPLNLRQDVGALWENFMISERLKYNNNYNIDQNIYFWRTKQKQEIDYLEERGGKLQGFEFKWNKGGFKKPKIFLSAYPESSIELVNRENYKNFVL
ncbi:ATP-binding protein [Patescibacteria group bacterium]|nr:ATP-binding protein [Candidatus Falkowbacteria bacterium]MBU3905689.1 ATP-binding protein [Patescibacteria group bacterium]MCG2698364.1 ATP-binding protein [Candidatus Parcubacteria bacterium]MBU4015001.1 ATP-binding protein [Patescibacteria group bacterium]MBU4026463.1 ATP-binding protein [Patescibacteria group bacterium]